MIRRILAAVRLAVARLQQRWNQPVLVDNKPRASAVIGRLHAASRPITRFTSRGFRQHRDSYDRRLGQAGRAGGKSPHPPSAFGTRGPPGPLIASGRSIAQCSQR